MHTQVVSVPVRILHQQATKRYPAFGPKYKSSSMIHLPKHATDLLQADTAVIKRDECIILLWTTLAKEEVRILERF